MKLKLIKKQNELGNVKTFIFKPIGSSINWRAGQYLIYTLKHQNEDLRGNMRFFTISSAPFMKNPSITTKIFGKSSSFKKALNNLKIGQTIEAKGPDGDFIINSIKRSYVFIAKGIGITPFRSILLELSKENLDPKILLIYQNKDKNIVFKKELDKLPLKNLKIKYLIGKRIGKKTISSIKGFKNKNYYVSGPESMVEATEKILDELGISKKNQYYDYFSGYKDI
jgi:ferredoxin-NADP reductase